MKKLSLEEIDPNFKLAATPSCGTGLAWHSVTDGAFTVRGLGWFDENGRSFCRLPHRAKKLVRPEVWALAQSPSSARICFRTDSTRMSVRMENAHPSNMPHFAATGSDGVFVYEGEPLCERPWNMAVPALGQTAAEKEIARDLPRRMRAFTLYLPLYAPLKRLEIGLDADARMESPQPCRLPRPVVFYGTSITQGGCASTAGGDAVSTVGRRLNLDVINLGFSGNGRGEPELADLLSELDAAAYVIDYCANTDTRGLDATLPTFLDILRRHHPVVPLICVSKIHFYGEGLSDASRDTAEIQRDAMIRHYSARRAAGDRHIHFVDGWSLVGAGEDLALVDGVHPTSQGFALMAERLLLPLRHVLGL